MADSIGTRRCPECGGEIPRGGACRENFHALLAMEWEIPGGPGEVAHFLAVASYGLQHPDSMGFTMVTLSGLREAVADALAGSASMADIRVRVRRLAAAGRVTRRTVDVTPCWANPSWPMAITHVISDGLENYGQRVRDWARSVISSGGELTHS
jgi:hypothetical protein